MATGTYFSHIQVRTPYRKPLIKKRFGWDVDNGEHAVQEQAHLGCAVAFVPFVISSKKFQYYQTRNPTGCAFFSQYDPQPNSCQLVPLWRGRRHAQYA